MVHPLEEKLNAPAEDIMEAILNGFRAQVDVKGKLAELYLDHYLRRLEESGTISYLNWVDVDGEPDFNFEYNSRVIKVECKNVRNEIYQRPTPAYKVEIQKTRNSKDGSNTRSYPRNYFEILAVCTFNQTGEWNFCFVRSLDLEGRDDDGSLLKTMQRVPMIPEDPWRVDLVDILNEL